MRMCNLLALLATKFASHALYTDPCVHIKIEVYFGLKSCHGTWSLVSWDYSTSASINNINQNHFYRLKMYRSAMLLVLYIHLHDTPVAWWLSSGVLRSLKIVWIQEYLQTDWKCSKVRKLCWLMGQRRCFPLSWTQQCSWNMVRLHLFETKKCQEFKPCLQSITTEINGISRFVKIN